MILNTCQLVRVLYGILDLECVPLKWIIIMHTGAVYNDVGSGGGGSCTLNRQIRTNYVDISQNFSFVELPY